MKQNSVEYIQGRIDGIRRLYSELVKYRSYAGLEQMVTNLIIEEEAMTPTVNTFSNTLKPPVFKSKELLWNGKRAEILKSSDFFLQAFKHIPENKNGEYQFIRCFMTPLDGEEPTDDQVIDFIEEQVKNVIDDIKEMDRYIYIGDETNYFMEHEHNSDGDCIIEKRFRLLIPVNLTDEAVSELKKTIIPKQPQ